jgi:hypothetical protein
MKTSKIILSVLVILAFLTGSTSCVVYYKENNGKHRGWYKSRNHPQQGKVIHPGKGRGRGK